MKNTVTVKYGFEDVKDILIKDWSDVARFEEITNY